jgi:IS30 family transposase
LRGRPLRRFYPDNKEFHVCTETIYQALYVYPRGGLQREVKKVLRTGRTARKPHSGMVRQPRHPQMVNIVERSEDIEQRLLPGDWEGDLILGEFNRSAIGTLVDRKTRYVMLLHLPGAHDAVSVRDAMIERLSGIPEQLALSVTWDQGSEMALHREISTAVDVDIYFCDPHSPWQRGTNENTNGLLRQFFPKSTDLSGYTVEDLMEVEELMNNRPRKALGWATPAEALWEEIDGILSEQ